jgi:tRNA(His) 5'-end guanylyltransferase
MDTNGKYSKDALGTRMKEYYEDRTRFSLTRRIHTIIRVDGKAFHTYTNGLERPFDNGLIIDMDDTAAYLCENIQGAKFAYVQSDEISILVTDFDSIATHAWYDNNLQKMCSISAALATAKFNQLRLLRLGRHKKYQVGDHQDRTVNVEEMLHLDDIDIELAMFDSRVFQIPEREEVLNYFIWRQQDATRNSISAVAQSLYSHKELEGVSSDQKQELIFQKGINWNDYESRKKRGGIISKLRTQMSDIRTSWQQHEEIPIFTQDRDFLRRMIPIPE